MASILIIDDDIGIRNLLSESLENEGYETTALVTAEEGVKYLSKYEPDLILLDLNLPGMHGLEFLEKIFAENINIPVVVITSSSQVSTAVKAMKLGAYDYLSKPFLLDEISLVVKKAIASKSRDEQLALLRRKSHYSSEDRIIGESAAIKTVFAFIRQVAQTPKTTVLIRGETGTGKELVAKAIHFYSERANKPFVDINCSAFNENLLEAELFGYEPGAFTDAKRRKKGLLELAHEGSFFLDEIGDMALGLQTKILKVIEKQSFRRLGGISELQVDTRIISATSRNLEEGITKKTFREDLYYRLNVAAITLPPLRERDDDVLHLAAHFLNYYNREFKKNIRGFRPEVKKLLTRHSWPGNVRELRNVIEKAVLFETSQYITPQNFHLLNFENNHSIEHLTSATKFALPKEGIAFDAIEKALLENALHTTNGNQTQAAKLLKMSRETFKYRVQKFRIRYKSR